MQKIKTKFLLKFLPLLSLVLFVPSIASAQGRIVTVVTKCDTIGGLRSIICRLSELLGDVLPVLVALGMVYFVWGVVQYFIADDEQAKKSGKDRILYGVIGLAVIISVLGLVYIVIDTFTIDETTGPGTLDHLLPE